VVLGIALAEQLGRDNVQDKQGFSNAVLRDVKFRRTRWEGSFRRRWTWHAIRQPRERRHSKARGFTAVVDAFHQPRGDMRANLNLQSAAFRHALRLMICVALGDAFGRVIHPYRAYWIPMTIVLVLKPEFAVTFSRGVLRIFGTPLGLLLATALFHFLPIHTATEIALIGAFTFLMRWIGPANYGIFGVAVSALVVLLISITGLAPMDVIAARGINTIVGGGFALLAYAVWPTWERNRLPELFAALTDAYRGSLASSTRRLLEPGSASTRERERTRQAARIAPSNLKRRLKAGRTRGVSAEATGTGERDAGGVASVCDADRPGGGNPSEPQTPPAAFGHSRQTWRKPLELLAVKLRGRRIAEHESPDLRSAYRNSFTAPANRKIKRVCGRGSGPHGQQPEHAEGSKFSPGSAEPEHGEAWQLTIACSRRFS
jgi:hypothetical protein